MVVVASHAVLTFWPNVQAGVGISPPLTHIWHRGDFAVRVFFVLSGFVLSHSFWRSRRIATVQSAAIRRYFRLMVPVLFSVMSAFTLQSCGWLQNHKLSDRLPVPNPWLESFYVHEASFLQATYEGLYSAFFDFTYTTTLNVVLWTMAVELNGSFLVFSFLALAGSYRYRIVFYCVLLFVFDRQQQPYSVDFIVGTLLCDWHVSTPVRADRNVACLLMAILALCLGDLGAEWLKTVGAESLIRGQRLWPNIGAAMLVISVVRSQWLASVLQVRPLVRLGSCSFAIYLLHVPILCSVSPVVYTGALAWGASARASALLATAAFVLVSVAAGELGPRMLDPCGIQLGKWVEARVRIGKPATDHTVDGIAVSP